jgi:hypothetical protein
MTTTQRVPLADAASLKSAISGAIAIANGTVEILDDNRIRATVIDDLVYTGVFGEGAIRDARAGWCG